jgi:hypothetical protein
VWSSFKAKAAWKLDTDWLAELSYITISIPKENSVQRIKTLKNILGHWSTEYNI